MTDVVAPDAPSFINQGVRYASVANGAKPTMKNHKSARIAAMLGAVALGTAAIAGGATAANAEPAGYGNIDFTEPASLTVHKYLHQSGAHRGDISEAPEDGDFTDPVEDVVFTVYPLLDLDGDPLDLTDPETWDDLNAIVAGDLLGGVCAAPDGYTLGTGIEMDETDADGMATQALPIGVYQVCETSAPARIVDRALPFILTIPMPHGNGWVYDVHAFPKNGEGEIVKSITPVGDDTGLGSVLRFPVTMTIPEQANPWTMFEIADAFDTRLTPDSTVDGNDGVVSVTLGGVALDEDYYEVDYDGATNTSTVGFTAAGIAWLNTAPGNLRAGGVIVVTFEAAVTTVGTGSILNRSTFQNDPSTVLTSDPVTTRWGALEVLKRAAGTEEDEGLLEGAVFEVYNAVEPYPASLDCTAAVADTAAGAITVVAGGVSASTFPSDANGIVRIAGLFVSDSVNAPTNATQRCYVLKEIERPAGYVLPSNPYTGVVVTAGAADITANADIENTQSEVPELPLTGAAGQILLVSAGVAGLAIAAGLMLMNRRRTQAKR